MSPAAREALAIAAEGLRLVSEALAALAGQEVQPAAAVRAVKQPLDKDPAELAAAATPVRLARPAPAPEPVVPGQIVLKSDVRCCEACGKQLVRKKYPTGKWEPPGAFGKRRTCDKSCSAAWRVRRQAVEAETAAGAPQGPLCETHGERIGQFGCTACNAAKRWKDNQRSLVRKVAAAEAKRF